MRCHNLAGAALKGIKHAFNFLTLPRGTSITDCSRGSSILSVSVLLISMIAISFSFYYRNMRWNPRVHPFASLSRFPCEATIFLLYASTICLRKLAFPVLSAFLNTESRTKMWEGMDLYGGNGRHTLLLIGYFFLLEIIEMNWSLNLLLKKYAAIKNKALLPVTEEKEILLESIDEKRQVSIYEAIATTPAPSELESEPLVADSESNTTPTPIPSFWQRVKTYIRARPIEFTAESVTGRFYLCSFLKSSQLLSFVLIAGDAACELTPEQYFDNKTGQFMLVLVVCLLWAVRSAWILTTGFRFARAELKERNAL